MKRQRLLRNTSAQNLCAFCACRLGFDLTSTNLASFVPTTTRKTLTSTRRPFQSAAATAASNGDNASVPDGTVRFVLDPNSSLTETEQREKARRQETWRQQQENIQAKEQGLEQKQIWREASANKQPQLDQAISRLRGQQRAQEDSVERFISTNPQEPHDAANEPASSQLDGISEGKAFSQALFGSKKSPLSTRYLSPNHRLRAQQQGTNRHAVDTNNDSRRDGRNMVRKQYKDFGTFADRMLFNKTEGSLPRKPVPNTESGRLFVEPQNQTKAKQSQSPSVSKQHTSKPTRVAVPDFLNPLKDKSTAPDQPVSGWGASATEMKPVYFENTTAPRRPFMPPDGSATANPAIQDVTETLSTDPEQQPRMVSRTPSQELPRQLPSEESAITQRHEEPPPPPTVVNTGSFGYFGEEVGDASSSTRPRNSDSLAPTNPQNIAASTEEAISATASTVHQPSHVQDPEETVHPGTFGSYGNQDHLEPGHTTGMSQSSHQGHQSPSNQELILERSSPLAATKLSEGSDHASGGFGLSAEAVGPSQDAFGIRQTPFEAPLHQLKPYVSSDHQASLNDQVEHQERPVASGALNTLSHYQTKDHDHQGGIRPQFDLNEKIDQNRHSGTGYRVMPLEPDNFRSRIENFRENQSATWQHLRRRNPEELSQPVTTSKPETQQYPPQQQLRARDFGYDNSQWVEEQFHAHQKSRAPPLAPMNNAQEPLSLPISRDPQSNANRTCARCGQKGHIARDCVGTKGYASPFDEGRPILPRKVTKDAPISRDGKREGSSWGAVRSTEDDPFADPSPRPERERRPPRGRNVFDEPSARASNRNGMRSSRVSNPFANNNDSGVATVRFSPNAETNRQDPRGRQTFQDASRYEQMPFPPAGQRSEEERRSLSNRKFQSETEAGDGQRDARTARQARWEGTVDEAGEHGTDRRKEHRSSRKRIDDEEDEHEGARDAYRARKAARQAAKDREKQAKTMAQRREREAKKAEQATPINLPEFISVQHLSQLLGVRYEQFVERLQGLGYDDVFPGKTLNSETSGMIAMEYDFEPVFDTGAREEEERDLKARPEVEDKEILPTRPSVVTIMGHVDHGKTTILDYLRKSSVAAGEAGGITQHIGAFSVPLASSGKTITFLDTPGHAAFLAMRQRGANVTDIVVLVVAADDSVKPQTLEAIKHAKAANVPMIVAINKIDKEEADVQRCKSDLARHGVEIEDFGGDTQVVCVSGKTGRGMDELEESVVTLSEILDHRAETDGTVEGWVLEATTKKAGRVATILVRRGTLKSGSIIVAGKTWARVRTLRNEGGKIISEVGPGMPVEVDGWRDQPTAGDEVLQASTEQKATSVVDYRLEVEEREKIAQDMEVINEARRNEQLKKGKEKATEYAAKRSAAATDGEEPISKSVPEPDSTEQQSGPMTVPFIIKADVSGSAEAVSAYILSVSNPLIAPQVLLSAVGSIRESDIELADAASGHIIAFNLPKDEEMKGIAEARGVKVLENDIIYRLLDDVKVVLEEQLPPVVTQRVLGEAEIGAAFDIGIGGRKTMKIAGCKVRNGVVSKGGRVRVLRGGEKVYDGTISSLKNVKKDVQEMRKGTECGMGFEHWAGFEVGDQIQTYEEISEKRKL